MRPLSFFVTALLIATSCSQKVRPLPEPVSPTTGTCPLPDTRWMVVKTGYDSKSLLKMTSQFKAAIEADLENLKNAKASADFKFTSAFSNMFNSVGEIKTEVSQEFYENYRSRRDAVCNNLYLLEKVDLNEKQKEKTLEEYHKLNDFFSKAQQDLEKKEDSK